MTDESPHDSRPIADVGASDGAEPSPVLNTSDESNPSNAASLFVWLVSCATAAAIIGLLAAHAPLRIRLIGLFPIAVGVFAGVVFAHISVRQRRPAKSAIVFGTILAMLMLIGASLESHRTFANEVRAVTRKEADKVLLATMQQGLMTPGDKTSSQAAAMVHAAAEERAAIPAYLQHRLSGIGDIEHPWPLVVWILETLLGAAACGIMIGQCLSSHTGLDHELAHDRTTDIPIRR